MTRDSWYALGLGALLLFKKGSDTTDDVSAAIDGTDGAPNDDGTGGGMLNVKLTGYWPSTARPDEVGREGLNEDRLSRPLHTLEQHQADPTAHPYVSVSGDDAIWPYGQRLEIDNWPGLIFRVVDTGGSFRGVKKVYRVTGYEPLDICVDSSATVIRPSLSRARVIAGDIFADGSKGQRLTEVQSDLLPDGVA